MSLAEAPGARRKGVVAAVERALALAGERSELGAFWALDPEGARGAAARVEASAARGEAGPLAGTPVAIKDLFDLAGLPTTAGVVGDHPNARSDAEAVRRLRRAGAIPIGKTAMDQLAATTGGQAPGFPPCLSPVDPAFSPGGSSSGSAVAVAAGIVPVALGTDTAGSIRVPAAYCGIVGFMPSRRAIPRRGSVPAMPGFDTAGVLGRSVADCVGAYRALTSRRPSPPGGAGRLRAAVLTDLLEESESAVAAACEGAVAGLDPGRVELERAELGWRGQGLGVALAWELAQVWGEQVDEDPDRFTDLIRSTIEFGRRSGAEGHRSAMAGIERARARLRRRFSHLDALVCPTVPVPAPDRDRETTPESTRFTRIFSALGWPAFSLPAGRDRDGRPIAVQVAAPPSRVDRLIELARALEPGAAAV